jgi:heat-inducible transcriptional repressor
VQPHTSAGRIPTTVGYRFYVDHLMTPARLSTRPRLGPEASSALLQEDVHDVVRDACRLLATLTEYPSVASAPTGGDVVLHRVFLAHADTRHVLLVMLFSTGHTESRVVELPTAVGSEAVAALAERLNACLSGRSARDVRSGGGMEDTAPASARDAYAAVLAAAQAGASALAEDQLFVEGANLVLRQREFQDVLRMEQVLSVLMEGNTLMRVLQELRREPGVAIVIGSESRVEALDCCSLVTRRYQAGTRGWGHIGVLGPTRMRYDRAVAAVDFTARALSAALARASFA